MPQKLLISKIISGTIGERKLYKDFITHKDREGTKLNLTFKII